MPRPHTARRLPTGPAVVAAWLALACAANAQQRSLEYPIKATYLYKFAPFIDWPAAAFASASSPIVICVVGKDPFGAMLDKAVADTRVGERPVAVRRINKIGAGAGCHIVYAAGSADQSVADALQAVGGSPVLTVTDQANGDAPQGVIHFVIKDNRVRFVINPVPAAAGGLSISSKLLSLALTAGPK